MWVPLLVLAGMAAAGSSTRTDPLQGSGSWAPPSLRASRPSSRSSTRTDPLQGSGSWAPPSLRASRPSSRSSECRFDSGRHDGRDYLEFVTGGASPGEPLPMIVGLHSLGSDPETFAGFLAEFPARARVIIPRGRFRHGNGYSWFEVPKQRRRSKYALEKLAPGVKAAAKEVAALIECIRVHRPTLGMPIVAGFSQGGMVAYALAVRHPKTVGGVVPIGGYLPSALWPARDGAVGAPIYALHGGQDHVVNVDPTRRMIRRLRWLGWNARLRVYGRSPHAVTPRMRRDMLRLVGVMVRKIRAA